jgi:hypothetical protein
MSNVTLDGGGGAGPLDSSPLEAAAAPTAPAPDAAPPEPAPAPPPAAGGPPLGRASDFTGTDVLRARLQAKLDAPRAGGEPGPAAPGPEGVSPALDRLLEYKLGKTRPDRPIDNDAAEWLGWALGAGKDGGPAPQCFGRALAGLAELEKRGLLSAAQGERVAFQLYNRYLGSIAGDTTLSREDAKAARVALCEQYEKSPVAGGLRTLSSAGDGVSDARKLAEQGKWCWRDPVSGRFVRGQGLYDDDAYRAVDPAGAERAAKAREAILHPPTPRGPGAFTTYAGDLGIPLVDKIAQKGMLEVEAGPPLPCDMKVRSVPGGMQYEQPDPPCSVRSIRLGEGRIAARDPGEFDPNRVALDYKGPGGPKALVGLKRSDGSGFDFTLEPGGRPLEKDPVARDVVAAWTEARRCLRAGAAERSPEDLEDLSKAASAAAPTLAADVASAKAKYKQETADALGSLESDMAKLAASANQSRGFAGHAIESMTPWIQAGMAQVLPNADGTIKVYMRSTEGDPRRVPVREIPPEGVTPRQWKAAHDALDGWADTVNRQTALAEEAGALRNEKAEKAYDLFLGRAKSGVFAPAELQKMTTELSAAIAGTPAGARMAQDLQNALLGVEGPLETRAISDFAKDPANRTALFRTAMNLGADWAPPDHAIIVSELYRFGTGKPLAAGDMKAIEELGERAPTSGRAGEILAEMAKAYGVDAREVQASAGVVKVQTLIAQYARGRTQAEYGQLAASGASQLLGRIANVANWSQAPEVTKWAEVSSFGKVGKVAGPLGNGFALLSNLSKIANAPNPRERALGVLGAAGNVIGLIPIPGAQVVSFLIGMTTLLLGQDEDAKAFYDLCKKSGVPWWQNE